MARKYSSGQLVISAGDDTREDGKTAILYRLSGLKEDVSDESIETLTRAFLALRPTDTLTQVRITQVQEVEFD